MLKLNNITKSYKTKDFIQNALNKVSLNFRENEFTSILGASGSGKTTMLNIIGGLDQYDDGDLIIEGMSTKEYKSSDWDAYRNSRVGFIFQSYNLIPHQSALANVELALTLSGVSAKERKKRAIGALDEVGLLDHIYKLPTQLSGGQMQRVAIARALINDPEIVLADEPTGALDSSTSEQVMELLKDIAKDRLVIMVTHNPELAEKYSNRIIELKDGELIADTNPYEIEASPEMRPGKKSKKTNMSFFTAVSLSISNLMTKKGRTFITALAGSIGIIGIALILALASGINLYIANVEKETMSAFPISIASSGIDLMSFVGGEGNMPALMEKEETEEDEVPVINTVSSLFSLQNKNDLKSFKNHIEANENKIKPYVRNIQYKYGITPQIYLKDQESGLRQVNPDTLYSQFGFESPSGLDMISGAGNLGMENFSELPGDVSLFEEQYNLVAGKWPSQKNELLIVLLGSGSLTDTTMYSLGLKDRKDLKNMFENLVNEENLDINEEKENQINFDEILGVSFKVVNPAEQYSYDESYNIWIDQSDNPQYMDQLIENSMDLNVVGIVKADPDINNPMLSSGLHYPPELTKHLVEEASKFDIVQKQIENKEINVFTGKRFDDEREFNPSELFNLEDFVSIDRALIERSFDFDLSNLDIDFSDLNINIEPSDLPALDLETLAKDIANQINVPVEEVQNNLTSLMQDFVDQQNEEEVTSLDQWLVNFDIYINSEEVQNKLMADFEALRKELNISKIVTEIVQNYFSSYVKLTFDQLMSTVQADFANQIQGKMAELGSSLENSMDFDPNILSQAVEFNVDEDELFNLVRSLGQGEQVNQSSILTSLGYRDLDDPSEINIFPKDFTTKESVVAFIEGYNVEMKKTDQEDKMINYTDFIAAILSSVTTIIDTISYALVAFVGISLVVSSIMIGVITYVSVLERIKEIGILRAIGASKKDIRRVFNAETLIIGFVAGAFGIIVTYGISFIANIVVYDKFGIPNIAYLESQAVAILILISMFLAFISGLIPSSTAANKDPVEALRSE